MPFSTTDFALHDACPRMRTWSAEYLPPKITLSAALHDCLREALIAGDATVAKNKMLELAASPGIGIKAWNLYEIVQHHAHLVELIAAYLLADGQKWEQVEPVRAGGYIFKGESFLMQDGRLRRVVLCDRWDDLRRDVETHHWRTLADVSVHNLPMLINAIVIGQSRKGFRATPWTTCHRHPRNQVCQLLRKDGSDFAAGWKREYREQTDIRPMDWLKMMQAENAFDGRVFHVTVEPPPESGKIVSEMGEMAEKMRLQDLTVRRSACFTTLGACPFSGLCHHPAGPKSPQICGWERK